MKSTFYANTAGLKRVKTNARYLIFLESGVTRIKLLEYIRTLSCKRPYRAGRNYK